MLTSGPGTATNPGTGAVVTCNTAPPNPATQPITAQPNSSNVRVNVLNGSELRIDRFTSVFVWNNSLSTNNGIIFTTRGGAGLMAAGRGNALTNNGTIEVSESGVALFAGSSNNPSSFNIVRNNGRITTRGDISTGAGIFGDSSSLANFGSIATLGSNSPALQSTEEVSGP